MAKKYPIETIDSLVQGIRLAETQGLSNKRGNFFGKFILSIVELHTLVQENKYQSHWNRKQADHFHTWLTYDDTSKSVVLNSRREDEWSRSLIDQAIEQFDQSAVSEWIKFSETTEYKENLKIVCDYYSRSGGYFRRLITQAGAGETLSRQEYEKIVKNKYAQKVIEAHNTDPVFVQGSLVDFRSSHSETYDEDGSRVVYKSAPLGLLILSTDAPIVSACKGARRYKVVPIGHNEPFYVEERYLKKRKKRK